MTTESNRTGSNFPPNKKETHGKDLAGEILRLSSELEVLKESVQKRKRENTALKVLLYTGFTLLLVGFIYSNTTLQRLQLQSLEGNVKIYQKQIQHDITAMKLSILDYTRKTMQDELVARDAFTPERKETIRTTTIRSALSTLNQLALRLARNNPELQIQANDLRSKSSLLLKSLHASNDLVQGSTTGRVESVDGKN